MAVGARPPHGGRIVADRAGTVVYANDAVETLLGRPATDLVGRPLSDLVPRRMLTAHRSAYRNWAAGGGGDFDGRFLGLPALHASGDEVPVRIVLSPIAGPMAVVHGGTTVTYEDVGADELAAGLPADVPSDLVTCVEETAESTATQLVQAAVDHAEFGPADDIAVLVLSHP